MALSCCIGKYYFQALTHQKNRAMLESDLSDWWGSAGKSGVNFIPFSLFTFPGELKR